MEYHKAPETGIRNMTEQDRKFLTVVPGGCCVDGPTCFYKITKRLCYFNVNSCPLGNNKMGAHYEYNPICILLEELKNEK